MLMKNVYRFLYLSLTIALVPIHIPAQIFIGDTPVDTMSVTTNLDTPWEILWGTDDHIWITERYGRVSRLDPISGEIDEVALIGDVHEQSESGLLGMVLHPEFPGTPHLFLVYNYLNNSSIRERLVRYTYEAGTLVSPVVLLEGIPGAGNHNGSRLAVGPDQKLYMTTGDAANTSTSQNLNSLAGKVLRFNLDGTIPEDNPIPGSPVWTWGHRNAQGLVFAPSGLLYSSEHGPSSDDEVNIIEKGRNYGWPNVRGFCDVVTETQFCSDSNVYEPIAAWTPTLAVSGADFYAKHAIPDWNNSVLVTSLKASRLVALKLSEDGRSVVEETQYFQNWFGRLRDLCISPAGEVYLAVSNRDGRGSVRTGDDRIVRVSAPHSVSYCTDSIERTICPEDSVDFYGQILFQPGIYRDTIPGSSGCDSIITLTLTHYEPNSTGLLDSYTLTEADSLILEANPGFVSYSWNGSEADTSRTLTIYGSLLGAGTHTITLEVTDSTGCTQLETTLVSITTVTALEASESNRLIIYPNPLYGSELIVQYTPSSKAIITVYDDMGRQFSIRNLEPGETQTELLLPDTQGLYMIKVEEKDRVLTRRILKL